MTLRQLYEAVLIELNKENAPNILLEDFNYFANKTYNQYVNKRYNIYDINQQTTDDLRVLKATAVLDVTSDNKVEVYNDLYITKDTATYAVDLPSDYLHLLNCICIYDVNKTYKCYNAGDTWRAAATRLTADNYSLVLDNFWMRPTYKRPYYYIHNLNTQESNPTNPVDNDGNGTDAKKIETAKITKTDEEGNIKSTDIRDGNGNIIAKDSLGINTINLRTGNTIKEYSNVEKSAGIRYGNTSKVRLEIRYGSDTSVFTLKKIYIDYLKTPQHLRLTQLQIDKTEDTSQTLEFPDYVCQEIINELVHIIMENISHERLQTHPVVSLSIANPAQQLTSE